MCLWRAKTVHAFHRGYNGVRYTLEHASWGTFIVTCIHTPLHIPLCTGTLKRLQTCPITFTHEQTQHTHAHYIKPCTNRLACTLKATHAYAHVITSYILKYIPIATNGEVPSASTQNAWNMNCRISQHDWNRICIQWILAHNRLENEVMNMCCTN
jgi:hypothetical protein